MVKYRAISLPAYVSYILFETRLTSWPWHVANTHDRQTERKKDGQTDTDRPQTCPRAVLINHDLGTFYRQMLAARWFWSVQFQASAVVLQRQNIWLRTLLLRRLSREQVSYEVYRGSSHSDNKFNKTTTTTTMIIINNEESRHVALIGTTLICSFSWFMIIQWI